MYVRYKKNIQENDLPRKRVRKASKIAGSGGQDLEIRYPERGRKRKEKVLREMKKKGNLEIRYPERGRKQNSAVLMPEITPAFGNKIPREGTETRYPERGRKQNIKTH